MSTIRFLLIYIILFIFTNKFTYIRRYNTLTKNIITIFFIFSLHILFNCIISNQKRLHQVFFFFGIITFLIVSLDATYELINGSNFFGSSSIDGRIAGLFGDRWVIGSFLLRFLPILVGIFFIEFESINSKLRPIIFFIFIFSLIIVLFPGERAAFLLSFLYLILLFFYIFKK